MRCCSPPLFSSFVSSSFTSINSSVLFFIPSLHSFFRFSLLQLLPSFPPLSSILHCLFPPLLQKVVGLHSLPLSLLDIVFHHFHRYYLLSIFILSRSLFSIVSVSSFSQRHCSPASPLWPDPRATIVRLINICGFKLRLGHRPSDNHLSTARRQRVSQ